MSDQPVIVGLGEVLWDLLPSGRQLGGAPANFAYHAQVLGGRGAIVSSVGNDPLGRELLRRLDELGLDRRHVAVDAGHPTGTVTVELDQGGLPRYVIHTDVAWDFIPWSDGLTDLAGRASAVCFGSLCQRSPVSRQTVRRFLEAMAPASLRVFDINLRQAFYGAETIDGMLQLSNVLKLNDEELPVVARLLGLRRAGPDALAELAGRYRLRLAALTRGPRGSLLCTPGETSDHPGFPVEVVDTVGAGDAFTAALVMGLLRGQHLDEINRRANRLGAYVCSQKGATPAVPAEVIA